MQISLKTKPTICGGMNENSNTVMMRTRLLAMGE